MSDIKDEDNQAAIYLSEIPEHYEIGTILLKAKTKEDLDALVDIVKEKYGPCLFTISHIAPKQREFLYKVVMYNAPLIEVDKKDE